MDRDTLEIRRTMSKYYRHYHVNMNSRYTNGFSSGITQSSVVRVLWHAKINQIITGSADGNIGVYYSPTASVRGAKLSVVREPKKRAVDDYEIDRPIITPHALPMFKEERVRSTKRKREKLRNDPKASRRPGIVLIHVQGVYMTNGLTLDHLIYPSYRDANVWPWKRWTCWYQHTTTCYQELVERYH